MDVFGPHSVSLDIELDSDLLLVPVSASNEDGEKKPSISLFAFNCPPPCAWDLIPAISEQISVNRLPKHGLHELELCLNLPSRGSMLNWEYVAAEFGFSNNKITHLRTSTNATACVLEEIAFRPLKNLLSILAKLNRVDAILSVQHYFGNMIITGEDTGTLSIDSGAFLNAEINDTPTCSGSSFPSSVLVPLSNANIANKKFILVTHHELGIDIASQKNYKWFLKNLRKQAKQANMSVFDIDDYLETSCQLEGLHTLFAGAFNIVCVFSDAYLEMLLGSNAANEQMVAVKQYLHKLMNGEFIERGDNHRFRAVTFQGTGRDVLPLGWAKSSLVYEFPANHLQLFRKLFS